MNTENSNEKRTVFLPKRSRNETERYVAVNGRRMLIRCGEPVSVPAEFAEVLEESRKQEQVSEDYISENRRDENI